MYIKSDLQVFVEYFYFHRW